MVMLRYCAEAHLGNATAHRKTDNSTTKLGIWRFMDSTSMVGVQETLADERPVVN
jgi:hypothetical protein